MTAKNTIPAVTDEMIDRHEPIASKPVTPEIQVEQTLIAKITEKGERYAKQARSGRSTLADLLTAGPTVSRPNTLADRLNTIAATEAAAAVYAGAADLLGRGHTAEQTYGFLLERVLAGPGDTWSGRSNDVRRAEFDGMTDAVKELRWLLPIDVQN